jgi:hypothetical protein
LAPSTPTAKKLNAFSASLTDLLGNVLPGIGGAAVGDEEDPGPVNADPVVPVDLLAIADHLQRGGDGSTHRGVATGRKGRRLERVGGWKPSTVVKSGVEGTTSIRKHEQASRKGKRGKSSQRRCCGEGDPPGSGRDALYEHARR